MKKDTVKEKIIIDNPDLKITIKEMENMKKTGKIDLDKVGKFLKQNFKDLIVH